MHVLKKLVFHILHIHKDLIYIHLISKALVVKHSPITFNYLKECCPQLDRRGADLLSLADLSHSMSNCHLSSTSLVSRHVITNTSFCTVHSNSHSATQNKHICTCILKMNGSLNGFKFTVSVIQSLRSRYLKTVK